MSLPCYNSKNWEGISIQSILIVIAGGTASGKSTVVEKIISQLPSMDITVIRHDDYYRHSILSLEERIKVNYDHPDSLDNELLVHHLNRLLAGKSIEKPIYDFVNHNRKLETEEIQPTKIIFLEGILALQDARIRELSSIKLFVESDDDIRFIRRLIRDTKERGRTQESVIQQYLTTVKPMHYQFIKPSKRYADIIIPNDQKHDVAVGIIVNMIQHILKEEQL